MSRHPRASIYSSLFQRYTAYYSGQVEEWRARMSTAGASSSAISEVGQSTAGFSSKPTKGSTRAPRPGESP